MHQLFDSPEVVAAMFRTREHPLSRISASSVAPMAASLSAQFVVYALVVVVSLTFEQVPLSTAATASSDFTQRMALHRLQSSNRSGQAYAGYSAAPKQSRQPSAIRKMLFGPLSCIAQDLSLTQGPVSSTSGIPTFNVQIVNLCSACAMGNIHVACGNWASATPVDPFVFTRLGYNDCLVNDGRALVSQGSTSFQYSNSAEYPMSIASATSDC